MLLLSPLDLHLLFLHEILFVFFYSNIEREREKKGRKKEESEGRREGEKKGRKKMCCSNVKEKHSAERQLEIRS